MIYTSAMYAALASSCIQCCSVLVELSLSLWGLQVLRQPLISILVLIM